jgi:hypothetical protein
MEDNIKTNLREISEDEADGIGSRSCTMVGIGNSSAETSGSTTIVLG